MHFEADMSVFCVSASCRLLTPSGLVLWARTWGSCIQEVSVGPPTRRSRQPKYIKTGLLFFFSAHLALGGSGSKQEPNVSAENRDTPQVRYQVLKTQGIRPLPELLKTRVIQQNNHYCLCCLFVCVFVCSWKPAFTPHWTWIKELPFEVGSWLGRGRGMGDWDGGRVSDVPWISWRSTSTESPAPSHTHRLHPHLPV